MCGIVGFTGEPNKAVLAEMNQALRHRGPDGEGFFVNGKVNLAMRRLAIIDLNTGDQPMYSEDKKVTVIFNGEIYNFKELRAELESKHKFVSQSDTEVIAHGYEEWGEQVLEKLNGMFAIAIWDGDKQRLVLARDRLGKKPLYYTVAKSVTSPSALSDLGEGRGEAIIFASEPKAILLHPQVKKQLSLKALNLYLTYEYVPGPLTIYENIYKLLPGHYLVWQNGDYKMHQYWRVDMRRQRRHFQEGEYLTKLDALLDDAVKIRLVSDVPLGVFLSGGIDSSTTAYYAQKNATEKIKTFSIGFNDRSFDESEYARAAARHLGTDHYEQQFTPAQVLALLPEIQEKQDEPFGDASLLPAYLLSKFTREKVTVALAGDGGDELLYGYPTFQMHKFSEYYFKLPKLIRDNIVSKIIQSLPTSFSNITLDYGLKRFDESTDYADWQRDIIWIGSFSDQDKAQLLTRETLHQVNLKETFQPLERYLHEAEGEQFLDKVSYLYLKTYLVDDILYKADRASMYASLEAREPFMDFRVVDLLTSLPPKLKMKGLKTKYILKKLMAGRLPDSIINRKKKGLGMPVAKWLTAELKPLVDENILNESFIREQGLFEYNYLKQLWQQHQAQKKDNRKELWTLLMFQLWYQTWLKN